MKILFPLNIKQLLYIQQFKRKEIKFSLPIQQILTNRTVVRKCLNQNSKAKQCLCNNFKKFIPTLVLMRIELININVEKSTFKM